jgi:preprotein translocase subunit SecF
VGEGIRLTCSPDRRLPGAVPSVSPWGSAALRRSGARARNPQRVEEPVPSRQPAYDPSVDEAGQPASVGSDTAELVGRTAESTVTGRSVHKYAQAAGPRNQPRRTPKSKR